MTGFGALDGPTQCAGKPLAVSVIIPHLNDLDRLRTCIAALEAQSVDRSAFEIVICDNGSDCGVEAVRSAAPSCRVVATAERGAGPARNRAMVLAGGAALAFTDSDCIPDRDWLRAGLAALETSDIAGGAITVGVADAARPSGAEAFEMVFAFDNNRYIREQGFAVTANLFARRRVLTAIGGFRTGVPEDLEWCRRARSAGFGIRFAPGARVMHPARHDFAQLVRKWFRVADELYGDWRRQGGSRLGWLGRAVGVLVSPFGHAPRIMTHPLLPDARSRCSALAVLFAIRLLRAWWMLRQVTQNRFLAAPCQMASPASINEACET